MVFLISMVWSCNFFALFVGLCDLCLIEARVSNGGNFVDSVDMALSGALSIREIIEAPLSAGFCVANVNGI